MVAWISWFPSLKEILVEGFKIFHIWPENSFLPVFDWTSPFRSLKGNFIGGIQICYSNYGDKIIPKLSNSKLVYFEGKINKFDINIIYKFFFNTNFIV